MSSVQRSTIKAQLHPPNTQSVAATHSPFCSTSVLLPLQAAEIFAAVHCNDPHRQEDMDYYSSALWQLNKVATLEVLAEELKQSDSSRPEAWCALGNVKSKYQNSTAAIKCFQKATEVHRRLCAFVCLLFVFVCVSDVVGGSVVKSLGSDIG